jgi:hypothetical protein
MIIVSLLQRVSIEWSIIGHHPCFCAQILDTGFWMLEKEGTHFNLSFE